MSSPPVKVTNLEERRIAIDEARLRIEQSWTRALLPLGAAVIGSVIAIVGSWWVVSNQLDEERRATRAASDAAFQLAIVERILDAKTCDEAVRRAKLAVAVVPQRYASSEAIVRALRLSTANARRPFPFSNRLADLFDSDASVSLIRSLACPDG